MKKISLLPLLFSLSFSVACGAQTQEANEQDKAKENIELKNNKEPSIPSLKRDIMQHWGYFFLGFIHELMAYRFILFFFPKKEDPSTLFKRLSLKALLIEAFKTLIPRFLVDIAIASIEETGKVDDNPNPLSYKKRLFRTLKLTFLPMILSLLTSICAAVYYYNKGDIVFDYNKGDMISDYIHDETEMQKFKLLWDCILYYYSLIAQLVCLVIYWLITLTIENAQTEEPNEQDKAKVGKTNYIA